MPPIQKTYELEMYKQGHGLGMWLPEPELVQVETSSSSPQLVPSFVSPGDVGFLYNSGFFKLFNIFREPDHPSQFRGVPSTFEQLNIKDLQTWSNARFFPAETVIKSGRVLSRKAQLEASR
jgi:hypothetical protein